MIWVKAFGSTTSTRTLLADGTLRRYITDLSITGLTSNPTIFDEAIKKSSAYDDAIERKTAAGGSGEGLFFRAGP